MTYAKSFYLAAGLMALLSSMPFSIGMAQAGAADLTAREWLDFLAMLDQTGIVGIGLLLGLVLISERTADFFSDYTRTLTVFILFFSLLSLITPYFAIFVLVLCLLVIKNSDFFGIILFVSLLTLGHGLERYPSMPLTAAFFACMAAAIYLRVVKTIYFKPLFINVLVIGLAIGMGWLTAFASTTRIILRNGSPVIDDKIRKPGFWPCVLALGLTILLSYILSRLIYLRSRTDARQKAEAVTGTLTGEETEAPAPRKKHFTGPAANLAIVRQYLKWRRRLGQLGILFRRDRTPDESGRYIAGKLDARHADVPPRTLARLTRLFNRARYNPTPMAEEEATEFNALSDQVLSALKTHPGSSPETSSTAADKDNTGSSE